MSSAITNAGEALIALHQNQETALVIDRFIVANVTGVDPAGPVDRAEGLPDPGDIVYQYTIPAENKGYINPNQVVYSMLLGSDIGDFEFNWLGLYSSADDTVVAITYCPTLSKWKTAHPAMGNAITRNFMLEYTGLQATTQITVEASTWQIDFTARLKGIDERDRLSNRDLYGRACFFDTGFLVVNDEGTFRLQPGTAYVEGIRIDQGTVQTISPGALPATVYLDVALQAQGSDRVAVATVTFAYPGDYIDATNDAHYGQPIAAIDAAGVVTDLRPTRAMGTGILAGVAGVDHTHDGYASEAHTHLATAITDLLTTPRSYSAVQAYTPVPLAIDSETGAVVWNMTAATVAELTLTRDVTSLTITNPVPGTSPVLRVAQGAAWSLSWPAAIKWPGGAAHEVSTEAGAVDIIQLDVGIGGVICAQGAVGYTEVS